MWGRAPSVAIMVLLVAAGCGSGAKKSSSPRAGVTAIGLGGIQTTGASGVVAVGSATQKVAADLAFVVVATGSGDSSIVGGSIGVSGGTLPSLQGFPVAAPSPPVSTNTAGAHAKIRAALHRLAIADAAIEFARDPAGFPGDPESIQIEVPVAKLPKIATAVVAAVEKAGANVTGQGLRFAVLDCTAAITIGRDKAIADAHKRAQALATAAGVGLGSLTSVVEQSAQSTPVPYLATGAPCGRDSANDNVGIGIGGSQLAALGAKPQVELSESVSVSYVLPTADRAITAVGTGDVSGPADAADILILPSSSGDVVPPGSSGKIDAAKVLHALAPLGIPKKDVEVENPTIASQFSSSSSYLRVHVTVARLKAVGAKVVSAAQSVVGTDGSSGVFFRASNCNDLLARARAAAAADAGKRLDRLARAANVTAGPVVGVSEAGSATSLYFPNFDPCDPNLDSLAGIGALAALASGGGGAGFPTLSQLDANPKLTEHVSVSLSRALSSS